jgi:hypothetical protein
VPNENHEGGVEGTAMAANRVARDLAKKKKKRGKMRVRV